MPDLKSLITARFAQSTSVPEEFFTKEEERIAEICLGMARRFHNNGRLLAFGDGPCATDAQHISVEFVHPVIVGKRALPALALTNDSATLSKRGDDATCAPFVRQIKVLAQSQDIAMGLSLDGNSADVAAALVTAKRMGLLTIGLAGYDGGLMSVAEIDHCFIIPSRDQFVIQETHETLYHILWELVHIFFEHEGLLA